MAKVPKVKTDTNKRISFGRLLASTTVKAMLGSLAAAVVGCGVMAVSANRADNLATDYFNQNVQTNRDLASVNDRLAKQSGYIIGLQKSNADLSNSSIRNDLVLNYFTFNNGEGPEGFHNLTDQYKAKREVIQSRLDVIMKQSSKVDDLTEDFNDLDCGYNPICHLSTRPRLQKQLDDAKAELGDHNAVGAEVFDLEQNMRADFRGFDYSFQSPVEVGKTPTTQTMNMDAMIAYNENFASVADIYVEATREFVEQVTPEKANDMDYLAKVFAGDSVLQEEVTAKVNKARAAGAASASGTYCVTLPDAGRFCGTESQINTRISSIFGNSSKAPNSKPVAAPEYFNPGSSGSVADASGKTAPAATLCMNMGDFKKNLYVPGKTDDKGNVLNLFAQFDDYSIACQNNVNR